MTTRENRKEQRRPYAPFWRRARIVEEKVELEPDRGILEMTGHAQGWQVRCRRCGLTFDAADLGFARIGGIGRSFKLLWCEQCRWPRWFVLERKPADLPERAGPRCDCATHARKLPV
jgi:hypothetical protein